MSPGLGIDPMLMVQGVFDSDIILLKKSEEVIDSTYGTTKAVYTSYIVTGRVVPITDFDIFYDKSGTIKQGQARGYFRPSYSFSGKKVEVMVGDRVFFHSTNWDVLSVNPMWDRDVEVYTQAILDREEF